MRRVDNDHGGVGGIDVCRPYDRADATGSVAFIDIVNVPPASSIGVHRHGDDEETYVILSGTGTMTIDDREFTVTTGDVIVNRPFGAHGLRNDSNTPLQLLVFETVPGRPPPPEAPQPPDTGHRPESPQPPDTGHRQRQLLARESAHLAAGASEEAAAGRRVFVQGRGAFLTDLDGNQYLDFAAGTLTQSLGHCHPEIVEALVRQSGRLWNVHDSATPERAELGEALARLLPERLDAMSFFSTGAEAVEAALRVVWGYAEPGRNRVGALRHGFHGKTQGARMLVHWDVGHQSFAGNSVLGYSPYCYRCPLELTYPSCDLACAKLVRRHIADKPTIAALIFEPVLGAAGVIVPPPGYWELIADACRANGVLLVADEVLTGGGRTGAFLASQRLGVEPDLVTLSKGLGSGFPFAALAGRREVMERGAAAGGTASTYGGNPLAAAVVRATLRVIARDQLIARVETLGEVLRLRLTQLRDRYEILGDVRGLGLLYGLEFVHDRRDRRPAPELARQVYVAALDLGLRTALGGNMIRLAPPFTTDENLLHTGVDLLDTAIGRVSRRRRDTDPD